MNYKSHERTNLDRIIYTTFSTVIVTSIGFLAMPLTLMPTTFTFNNINEAAPLLILIIPAALIFWSIVGYRIRNYGMSRRALIIWGFLSPFIIACLAALPLVPPIGSIYATVLAAYHADILIATGIITAEIVWHINYLPNAGPHNSQLKKV